MRFTVYMTCQCCIEEILKISTVTCYLVQYFGRAVVF